MTLAHFTDPSLVAAPLAHQDLQDIVGELVSRLENCGYVLNGEAFKKDVLTHENLVSEVYEQITYPSGHSALVAELSFAVGLVPTSIQWGQKASPVRAVILFAVPPSEEQTYLSLVVTFGEFFKDEEKRVAFLQCTEPAEVMTLLDQARLIRTGPKRSGWDR
jgi:mannitol/fructose-specific phosphotransferase system IIA component (Ntr-type)